MEDNAKKKIKNPNIVPAKFTSRNSSICDFFWELFMNLASCVMASLYESQKRTILSLITQYSGVLGNFQGN